MRRTVVWIVMLGALGVLAIRVWPTAPEPEAAMVARVPARPTPTFLAGTREMLDEESCAGPAIGAIQKHPHWELRLDERVWDDVEDGSPDQTLQTVRLGADLATWSDTDLPQTLELEPLEKSDLLAALARACVPQERGPEDNGFSGHYIEISYGAWPNGAIRLPSRSRAAVDALAVMDHVRARYVHARLSTAQVMTLTLRGPRFYDGWSTYTLTVRGDGHIVDADGEAADPLPAIDLVDTLDWAMQLPAKARGPHVVTGTLEIAGSKRPIAVQLDTLVTKVEGNYNALQQVLANWWRLNRDHER